MIFLPAWSIWDIWVMIRTLILHLFQTKKSVRNLPKLLNERNGMNFWHSSRNPQSCWMPLWTWTQTLWPDPLKKYTMNTLRLFSTTTKTPSAAFCPSVISALCGIILNLYVNFLQAEVLQICLPPKTRIFQRLPCTCCWVKMESKCPDRNPADKKQAVPWGCYKLYWQYFTCWNFLW